MSIEAIELTPHNITWIFEQKKVAVSSDLLHILQELKNSDDKELKEGYKQRALKNHVKELEALALAKAETPKNNTIRKEDEERNLYNAVKTLRDSERVSLFVILGEDERYKNIGSLNSACAFFESIWFTKKHVSKLAEKRSSLPSNALFEYGVILSPRSGFPGMYIRPNFTGENEDYDTRPAYPIDMSIEQWLSIIKACYANAGIGDATVFHIRMLAKEDLGRDEDDDE